MKFFEGWHTGMKAHLADEMRRFALYIWALLLLAARRPCGNPGFTAVCVLTLALGIGANSAIFSVINGILLKPLLYAHSDELIDLNHTAPGVNFPDLHPAPFLYFTYREQGRSFKALAYTLGTPAA